MKETTNSAKIFLESGTGKACRPPPPRRLEMAIMLSMESMRQYCLGKKSPGRHRQPGEAIFATALAPVLAAAREQRIAFLT